MSVSDDIVDIVSENDDSDDVWQLLESNFQLGCQVKYFFGPTSYTHSRWREYQLHNTSRKQGIKKQTIVKVRGYNWEDNDFNNSEWNITIFQKIYSKHCCFEEASFLWKNYLQTFRKLSNL